jgi:hypothetical protein
MKIARRHILRGAGVALALPWLESLAPRRARGQAARPRRFVPVFFPLGAGAYWRPTGKGAGDAWGLSPVLQPFAPLKRKVTVLSHVDATANATVAPGEATDAVGTGAFLTCAPCSSTPVMNGVSVDQRVARDLLGRTILPSLQVGLATVSSGTAGWPAAFSRSISWASATEPMHKNVDPQAVFDALVAGGAQNPGEDAAARARAQARKSVLDFVAGNITSLRPRLGREDGERFDVFLTSVRELEQRITTAGGAPGYACIRPNRPTSAGDREVHARVMIDLIVMALSCDRTRVVSVMLDDALSDYAYDFVTARQFTSAGSTPVAGAVGSLREASHAGDTSDAWATIDWWFASQAAELCTKLDAIPDGPDQTLLDNTLVWFGSGQRSETASADLPVLYAGSGGGVLKTDQHLDLETRLANVYLTFLNRVFGCDDASFGDSTGEVADLLA